MAFQRAEWMTEDMALFVKANEGMSWRLILNKWKCQNPEKPAPKNYEQLRRVFRGESRAKPYEKKPEVIKVDTVDKKCLGCRRIFPSEGKHNWMCDLCREKSW